MIGLLELLFISLVWFLIVICVNLGNDLILIVSVLCCWVIVLFLVGEDGFLF